MATSNLGNAVITGASSGIGAAFARALAPRVDSLALIARSGDRLRVIADELITRHSVVVHVIEADLATPTGVDEVVRQVRMAGVTVDLLINNAGFAAHGDFVDLSGQQAHAQVMLNAAAVVDLTHAFLPGMVARGHGSVINVASTASFQPVPYMAVYGATKAFVRSFSEALRYETRRSGVRVVALCPGPTETHFFDHLGEEAAVGSKLSPDKVATVGLRSLSHRSGTRVVGASQQILMGGQRFLPRSTVLAITGRLLRPRTQARHRTAGITNS